MVDVIAAVVGAFFGAAGMSWVNSSSRNVASREAVIELTAAVKSIAGKLDDLHQDMRADRAEIYTRLNDYGSRIAVLENRDR